MVGKKLCITKCTRPRDMAVSVSYSQIHVCLIGPASKLTDNIEDHTPSSRRLNLTSTQCLQGEM